MIQTNQSDVLVTVKNQMFIYFIGDGDAVKFQTKIADQLQFTAVEHRTGGVVRRIHNNATGFGAKSGAQTVGVEAKIGGFQRNCYRFAATHLNAGDVGIIHWCKHDKFIARFTNSGYCSVHGLGGAGQNGDFGCRIKIDAGRRFVLFGQSMSQSGNARQRRVLILTVTYGLDRCFFDQAGSIKVGKTLAQINHALGLAHFLANHVKNTGAIRPQLLGNPLFHRLTFSTARRPSFISKNAGALSLAQIDP